MSSKTAPTGSTASFDVLVIISSAGGLEAMSEVLADLPPGLEAAIIIGQHLGIDSTLPQILSRRTALPATWVRDGDVLKPGCIHVVPPRMRLEVLPDRSLALFKPRLDVLAEKPLDALLNSIADSCGTRALAVVLTGMGRDGSAGARAVKAAGGAVLVESPATAAYPEMPRAAIEAGAANLVLPLSELGRTVTGLMSGGHFPVPRNEAEARGALFGSASGVSATHAAVDWRGSAIGGVLDWPASLKSVVACALNAQFPMCVLWGDERVQIYNDAWLAVIGHRHPEAAGLPARATWKERWPQALQHFDQVAATGTTVTRLDQRIDVDRQGFVEEAYFTFSISPLADDRQHDGGLLLLAAERTASVLAERRLQTLRRLAAAGAGQVGAACERAAAVLGENERDIGFALIYVFDAVGTRADLCGCVGLPAGSPPAPHSIDLFGASAPWPLGRVGRQQHAELVPGIAGLLRGAHSNAWERSPDVALALPLPLAAGETGAALIVGLSPHLAHDEAYRNFLDSVAQQLAANLADAQLREHEQARVDHLARLDRTRAEFFSNISHEFRTPLTLILAPLEDLLAARHPATATPHRELELVARNARRLLNLVDTLLDFSQVEAGRLRARFQAVDLSTLTTDTASLFRSATEQAGIALDVRCAPAPRQVAVDAQMWEQVVSNLLSNALKFTFRGGISVSLSYLPHHVQLEVSDTGVGITPDDQAQIFQRFHRVHGARGRTDEGAGIGLAIVAELAGLHHGRVRVRSTPGEGSTFIVWISSDLAGDTTPAGGARASRSSARQLAREASAWAEPLGEAVPGGVVESMLGQDATASPARARSAHVLVADDNADMRRYLARILGAHWHVELAADGMEALVRARENRPDLLLADVAMPGLDGFGLLRELRADPVLKAVPLILVTAHAHEEAAIEGLLAGADDYVAKPFSSRELVARIGAQLALARVRRQGEEQMRELLALLSVGVYACDLDGNFNFWNPRAAELWGGEPPRGASDWALLGAPQALAADGSLASPDASPMAAVLRTGEPQEDREILALRADGTRLSLLVNIRPLREAGRLVGAVCAFLDVTARRAAEHELRALNEELERRVAQRTAELEASQQAHAYLLRLSDTLRPLGTPHAILSTAARLLASHLQAGHVFHAQVEAADWTAIDACEAAPGDAGPALPRSLAATELRRVDACVREGRVVFGDADADTPAWVAVPRVCDGAVVGVLCAVGAGERAWTAGEAALVEATAERSWAAVERLREASMQARNEELERFSRVTVGRELRMIELKEEVNELRHRLGEPRKYPLERTDVERSAP